MKVLRIILIFLPFIFGFTRVFYLDEEFKKSSLVAEIIIQGYTSRTDTIKSSQPITIFEAIDEVSYSYLSDPAVIYKYKPPYTGSINYSAAYYIRPSKNFDPMVAEGYWPNKGDTVLVVFNEEKLICLFADIIDNMEYKFWSPYHTSSWNTQFYGNYPFKPDTSEPISKPMYDDLQLRAKRVGYEFASFYHCRVNKFEFWQFYKKIENN